MDKPAAYRVGLTGGIGSGKSTAARMLVEHGAVLVDADAISRQVTAPGGAAVEAIARQFGPGAIRPDGAMDRDAVRALVFEDIHARQQLEAIIHPLVSLEAENLARTAAMEGNRCIVFDIPLLVESGRWRQQLDHVLVVDCAPATQLSRVLAREISNKPAGPGWTADVVLKIMAGQASRAQRLAAADACIYNDGISMHELGLLAARWARLFGL